MRRAVVLFCVQVVLVRAPCFGAEQPASRPAPPTTGNRTGASTRAAQPATRPAQPATRPALPAYRVEAEGFSADAGSVKALLDSASRELWRHFPDANIEPFVVTRGRGAPITLFNRNARGEIVIRLDTEDSYWSQYSYQFAHEFCHILCGFREDSPGNKWFEETLCETASLFVLRAMARSWKQEPPFPNWRDYRDSLRAYADDVVRKRDQFDLIAQDGLGAFYRANKETLRKEPCSRDLNGAMSLVLLRLFEKEPERWEAVRWLNTASSSREEEFERYLRRWHGATPDKHKEFVRRIARLYGIALAQP
jgi:hypothetical protein